MELGRKLIGGSEDATGPRGGASFYGSYYYAHYSVPYERNEHWTEFFGGIADRIATDLAPATVLDAGCAVGILVEALRERDIDAHGIDVSDWAIEHAVEGARGFCTVRSLAEPLPQRYDLITCIEVIEHIPEPDAGRALANLCAATDVLLLSSVPDDYAEATHVNVRPSEEWAARLSQLGFFHDVDFDATFVSPWASLFRRRVPEIGDLVRSYERVTARLREEVYQLRGAALTHEQQLNDAYDGADAKDLRAEVRRLQEQLLAERDQTTVIEAQLGEALGRTKMLESELLAYQVTERDFRRLTQLPFWPALARYLQLRTTSRSKILAVLRRLGTRS